MMEVSGENKLTFAGLDSLIPPIAEAFAQERICRFKPLPLAAAALLAIEMKRLFKRPVVLITESAALMDEMRRNLDAFAAEAEETILDYPPREDIAGEKQFGLDQITAGERLRTLAHVSSHGRPFLINTCVQALMQKTISPDSLKKHSLHLFPGQEYDLDRLTSWLEQAGYEFVPVAQDRSQVARRGGLTDIWPPAESHPLRIEFSGLTIESIRRFDPVDQRSIGKIQDIILPPASETVPTLEEHSAFDSLACYLPEETIFFWTEKYGPVFEKGSRHYSGIVYHAELHEKAAAGRPDRSKTTVSFNELTEIISGKNSRQCLSVVEYFPAADLPIIDLGFQPIQNISLPACPSSARELGQGLPPQSFLTPDIAHENRRRLLAQLEEKARQGMKVHFFFGTQGSLDHFRSTVSAGLAPVKSGRNLFHLHLGTVSDGFLHDELRLAVISEPGLLFPTKTMRRHSEIKAQRLAARRSMAGETITDRVNIEPGDLVVHLNHGIGKYLGLHEIVFNGKLQEVFAVEYADRAKLYVPVSQAHLLSHYVTAGGRRAKIHRLGGSQWLREKQSAQNAIYDIAAALLETQALRETLSGFAFPADTAWQHDFEAAFPYEETEDQERAISEVKSDMEALVPMDRLICGDAGYGKTEVAIRAAFKTVMAGKQVAILVPTTVLALQHYEVFQQRMEAYPVRVELLCRFRSAAEQQRIVGELQKGAVDIVIGTHRLIQADLGFKDLGLIIIDEEQRFGVGHKEHLKHLKKLADVLTLTATPIPRTLYMSLTGARKISMVQTPPKMRLPIETIVARNDDSLVRAAILRELNRGGQVFYLHNRVATIDKVFGWLKKIVPEARLAVAHGQMSSRELAEKMHAFGQGLFDVLLCTTIIESGVDLPNVNTILIDRADRFGIADLYQLRGRVGRADRKAYAYLLTPVHGYLLDISRRRLQAIMEHSNLGAGFKLAMLDLEIRGAGNMLGHEQSGHIAAIGFDLYCQLLRRAVEYVKNGGKRKKTQAMIAETVDVDVNLDFIDLAAGNTDSGSAAFLPIAYIEDEQTRVSIYRKIVSAGTADEIESLRNEFKDRFGPLPAAFERLLKIAAIRVKAAREKISAVESKEGKIMFSRRGEYLQIKNQFPRLRSTDTDGKLEEIVRWLGRINKEI
ncbi:MAG: transcription-repair coupling factor [Kiritimatiellia bacterium]|nr:transcription-repair coupling factor [Kiritimatiellia bacterium]